MMIRLTLCFLFCSQVNLGFPQQEVSDSVTAVKLEKPRSEEVFRFNGDRQTQTVNTCLERSVRARVVDGNGEPREGYLVYFRKISAPENASGFILSDTLIYTDELEKQHYERLKEEVNKSISSSKTHLELLGLLKVINERATNIARILLKWSEKG